MQEDAATTNGLRAVWQSAIGSFLDGFNEALRLDWRCIERVLVHARYSARQGFVTGLQEGMNIYRLPLSQVPRALAKMLTPRLFNRSDRRRG
jgi:hypothetical protein